MLAAAGLKYGVGGSVGCGGGVGSEKYGGGVSEKVSAASEAFSKSYSIRCTQSSILRGIQ